MRFGSLFSGIGGLDLGLERAGMTCAWQVEIDDWCRKVLTKHWPDVPKYGDIKELSGEELEPVDLIVGGFPCQPVSYAGKGLAQDDPRWLWPEFQRLLGILRPRYVLIENVPGLADRGMSDVLAGLASLGFNAEWTRLSAAEFGAPHLRERIFIAAYANGFGCDASIFTDRGNDVPTYEKWSAAQGIKDWSGWERWFGAIPPDDADAAGNRLEGIVGQGCVQADGASQALFTGEAEQVADAHTYWDIELSESYVRGVDDGIPHLVDRLRGLGNAVVPQVAQWIGERMMMVQSDPD